MKLIKRTTYDTLDQGTDEWHQLRSGIITASKMKSFLTPKNKPANNSDSRAAIRELVAERICGWSSVANIGSNGLRGHMDEILVRDKYHTEVAPIKEVGFIRSEYEGGICLGYSPDGVAVDGSHAIEIKSRLPKHHVQVVLTGEVPSEHIMQCQMGMFVGGFEKVVYISCCGGMNSFPIDVYPDRAMFDLITQCAQEVEAQVAIFQNEYHNVMKTRPDLAIERIAYEDEFTC